jgi:hypothetical protein
VVVAAIGQAARHGLRVGPDEMLRRGTESTGWDGEEMVAARRDAFDAIGALVLDGADGIER